MSYGGCDMCMSCGQCYDYNIEVRELKLKLKQETERRKEAEFTLNGILEVTDCSWERNLIEVYNSKYKDEK